jgi:hypothetical protein
MSRQHDVDSLEALLATLAWYRMKQRMKRWARAVPVVAFVLALAVGRKTDAEIHKCPSQG